MEFRPDSAQDVASCADLNNQISNLAPMQAAEADNPNGEAALVPPSLESPLPSAAWFEQFEWQHLRTLSGATFVQLPKRFEEAFSDALGVALREMMRDDDPQRQLAGWKAFLVLPWLLLFRPPAMQDNFSCADLLSERLDRCW